MKTKKKKSLHWILVLAFLLIFVLIFSACNSSPPPNAQETADGQKNEVYLPAAGSDSMPEAEAESESEKMAYPDSEQGGENAAAADSTQEKAYPAPKEQTVSEGSDPTPDLEPTKGPQPTSRGDELYATNPSTFALASGQVQLVELFAFW